MSFAIDLTEEDSDEATTQSQSQADTMLGKHGRNEDDNIEQPSYVYYYLFFCCQNT